METIDSKGFIEAFYPIVSKWNKDVQAPLIPENEFNMVAQEWFEKELFEKVGDIIEIVDAYCDVLFVSLGTAHKFNMNYDSDSVVSADSSWSTWDRIKKVNVKNYLTEEQFTDNVKSLPGEKVFIAMKDNNIYSDEFFAFVSDVYEDFVLFVNDRLPCFDIVAAELIARKCFQEVCDSNDSKLEFEMGYTYAKKDSNGKIRKSDSFQPPNLEKILSESWVVV